MTKQINAYQLHDSESPKTFLIIIYNQNNLVNSKINYTFVPLNN